MKVVETSAPLETYKVINQVIPCSSKTPSEDLGLLVSQSPN